METTGTPTPVTGSFKRGVGVSGILVKDGNILLLRRAKHDPSLPGMLCTPGGGVDENELDIDDALKREFMEETNLAVRVYKHWVCPIIGAKTKTLILFKHVELDPWHPRQLVLNEEHDGLAYYSRLEIEDYRDQITPSTYAAIQEFYKSCYWPH